MQRFAPGPSSGSTSRSTVAPWSTASRQVGAVPLKWRLLDETGAPVLDLQSVELTFLRTSCDTSAVDPVEDTVSVGSGLQNKGDGNYQLNWKTPSAKRCGTLQLDVGDGVLHTAKFRLT